VTSLDLILRDEATGDEMWRGPLPAHAAERLVAATHLAGILAGTLPNDGAPVRLDSFELGIDDGPSRLTVAVGAGDAVFQRTFSPAVVFHQDAQVILTRLLAAKTLPAGTYRFAFAPGAPAEVAGIRMRPLPRRLPALAETTVWDEGLPVAPRCGHLAILLGRGPAERFVARARVAGDVEVGALLLARPLLFRDALPCRLGTRIVDAVPLAHGTEGTRTRLRITPEALAAVAVGEARRLGGLAHSHPAMPFGEQASALQLSIDDQACASAYFWLPFMVQLVVDPRFSAPEDAVGAFAWVGASLARVCLQLVDEQRGAS
jgi:hypothetical protein